MFVCVCFAVTDSTVESVIGAGASTVADVTQACRAGGDCGACHSAIEGMIEAAYDDGRVHLGMQSSMVQHCHRRDRSAA